MKEPFTEFKTEHTFLKFLEKQKLISFPTQYQIHNEIEYVIQQSNTILDKKIRKRVLMPSM